MGRAHHPAQLVQEFVEVERVEVMAQEFDQHEVTDLRQEFQGSPDDRRLVTMDLPERA